MSEGRVDCRCENPKLGDIDHHEHDQPGLPDGAASSGVTRFRRRRSLAHSPANMEVWRVIGWHYLPQGPSADGPNRAVANFDRNRVERARRRSI